MESGALSMMALIWTRRKDILSRSTPISFWEQNLQWNSTLMLKWKFLQSVITKMLLRLFDHSTIPITSLLFCNLVKVLIFKKSYKIMEGLMKLKQSSISSKSWMALKISTNLDLVEKTSNWQMFVFTMTVAK